MKNTFRVYALVAFGALGAAAGLTAGSLALLYKLRD
jgi:hypothetical protein